MDQALAEIERVLKDPDTEGQQERARFIKSLIEESMAGFKPTEADEALAKADTLENSPVQDILDKLRQERDKYDTYLSREDVNTKEMTFSCLRGWSSAVTLLEGGSGRRWSGGGYFLRWKGKGIVIDPGFDFLDNFHDANFHMRDVDAIVVSHNHLDHNGDLNRLDDLRYQIHRVWKRKIAAKEEMKNDVSRCLFAMDEDTARSFPDDDLEYRGPPFKFSSADSKHKRWLERLNELPATVEFFPVQHGNDVPHAMGIRLRLHQEELPDFVFGYTGDTGYFDTLPKYLEGCDVLLAHISMPDTQEYTDPKHFKKVHLGYNGLTKLIQEAKPKMVLVGEFWAGLADIRIDLIKGLRSRTEGKIPILPTGLGFHLKLPTLEVECTSCRKPASYDQIKIAPATSPFGPLGYLCPRCLG